VQKYDLFEFLAAAERSKAELGILQTEPDIESCRNQGANRTPAKSALLKRTEARATAAGKVGPKSYY